MLRWLAGESVPVEIMRNTEAAALWEVDYPRLSGWHGTRPARLAKLLARAEANVTRLSLLIALLDGSRVILPEHHRAALAMWDYVENSARWIFGTSGTGHKDADKR